MEDTATSVPVSEMTPAAVDAEIQSVMADTDHAYWSLNDPAKDAAKERMVALYERKAGAGDTDGADEPTPAYQPNPETGISQTASFDQMAEDLMAPAASPDDYNFTGLRNQLGEDDGWDAEMETKARGWLHKLGLSEAEGEAALRTYAEISRYTDDQFTLMQISSEKVLTAKYGDELGANMEAAKRAAHSAGGDEFLAFLQDTRLGLHSPVIERLIRASKELKL